MTLFLSITNNVADYIIQKIKNKQPMLRAFIEHIYFINLTRKHMSESAFYQLRN